MKKSITLLTLFLMMALVISAIGCGGREAPTPIPTPTAAPTPPQSAEPILHEIEARVSEIRGLSQKTEIEPEFLTKQELKAYLEKDFTENNPAEELRTEKAELVMLDLLPPDYDLPTHLLELSEEQVIGFYDDKTKEMVVLGDLNQIGPAEKVTFAHEYDHALEDQSFNLQSLPLHSKDNSDLVMAALSVAEGDATLVMTLYAHQYLSPSEIQELAQSTAGNNTAFDSAPSVIRETLLFPYTQGTEFTMSIFILGGWEAVNQLYIDVPKSTEQIIHPEKYVAKEQPQEVTIPDLKNSLGDDWSQLDSNVLGELYMKIYLEAFVDSATATKASEGWGGDRYVFYEDANQRDLLALRSTWDTPQDAQEFFDAYLAFVHNKGKDSWSIRLNSQDKMWWTTTGQSVYLSKQGNDVLVILAPDENTVMAILPQFAEL
jgi:hypothetical protein